MGADRPESGSRSKRTKCTKKFLTIVMGAVRPVAGLRLKRPKSDTTRFLEAQIRGAHQVPRPIRETEIEPRTHHYY